MSDIHFYASDLSRTGLNNEPSPMRHEAINYTIVKLVEIGYNRSMA